MDWIHFRTDTQSRMLKANVNGILLRIRFPKIDYILAPIVSCCIHHTESMLTNTFFLLITDSVGSK